MPEVITDNLDLWTSALLTKSTAGRGSNGKLEAYGIKKLRELILELAVRGKLVPQDPNDEPASVLLEKIAKEKAQLIQEGLIKKEKPRPEIGDEDKPFKLPNGWKWVRLQDVSSYVQRGKGPRYADFGKVQVVSQKCIQWAGFDVTQAKYVDDASLDGYQPERFLRKNDLLWNSTGTGTAGRINVVPEVESNSLVADSHVTIIRPLLVSSRLLSCYVSAPGIQQRIEPEHENSLVSGTTNQVELNLSAVVQLVVPIPPLAEQHRIVAKVDELMALCDQLEQEQTDSLAAHQTLVETLLGTLTRVESQQEFSAAWARIASHFDTLFTTEASIDQLKQTVLQLAVMGKLVPQDPNDEPASELVKEIAALRFKLVKEGKLKPDKPLPPIKTEELPHYIPAGWTYERFDRLAIIERGGSPRPIQSYLTDQPDGLNWIKIGDTDIGGKYISATKEKIIKEGLNKTRMVYPGDFLLTNSMSFGRPYITKIEGCIHDGWLRISPAEQVDKDFLYILLSSPYIVKSFTESAAGAVVQNLNSDKVREVLILLPPLAEQHRIVAKVDELMALCDALKARLADAQATQIHLADAIVEQAVA